MTMPANLVQATAVPNPGADPGAEGVLHSAEATEAGDQPDETTSDYAYGPPPLVPRESNYVSDENLLIWLAQKQDGLHGELRDHMDMSRARSKLMEDLNRIKVEIDKKPTGEARVQLRAEMDTLLAAYAGTELEQEVNELISPMKETLPTDASSASLEEGVEFADVDFETMSAEIKSKIDALGRDDQLALIEIQSLTADIREASQLASNLIASKNQASNTIVGNIAR